MPSPVFLWEGTYGGAHRSLPYAPMMGFRRAACPHTAAKGGQGRSPLRMDLGTVQPGRCGERAERRQWRMKRSERVAAVKISSVRRKAAQKFWAPQQDHRPLRRFSLTKSSERPKMGRSGDFGFCFYFLALLSTTSRSRAVKSSRDMAPRSPSTRCRGETVPFSMSRSPTTTM